MTEKEIMKRLTHAMVWHLFKPTFQGATETVLSSERTLFDRLGGYLIDKTGLMPIFEYLTSLATLPDMMAHRTYFYELCQLYDQLHKRPMHTPRGVVPLENFHLRNGDSVFKPYTYAKQRIEAIYPQLEENFPLLVIYHLVQTDLSQDEEFKQLVDDYLMAHYVQPLREAIPGIQVTYDFEDLVVFRLDVSQISQDLIPSLAKGTFPSYRIELIGGV